MKEGVHRWREAVDMTVMMKTAVKHQEWTGVSHTHTHIWCGILMLQAH